MSRKTQQVVAFAFGVIFVLIILAIAIRFPNPTHFQYTVFRIVLALAASGVAAMIPGFINVSVGPAIRAGGAIAVFVIVYFFSPAQLVSSPEPPPETIVGPSGSVLTVEPGKTFIVDRSKPHMVVERLEMGKDSRIAFPPGMASWKIVAQNATFAGSCKIDGRGTQGEDGHSGSNAVGQPGYSQKGYSGERGKAGKRGANGVDIDFLLGLSDPSQLAKLTVDAIGGRGGNGGNGGNGGIGGGYDTRNITDWKPGGDGGDGANGGDAGEGGNGGNIRLAVWWTNAAARNLPVRGSRLTGASLVSEGGEAGTPGAGGRGQDGHPGHSEKVKVLGETVASKSIGGGRRGNNGSQGRSAVSGSTGSAIAEVITAPYFVWKHE